MLLFAAIFNISEKSIYQYASITVKKVSSLKSLLGLTLLSGHIGRALVDDYYFGTNLKL